MVVLALFDEEALAFLWCLEGRESGTTVFSGAVEGNGVKGVSGMSVNGRLRQYGEIDDDDEDDR